MAARKETIISSEKGFSLIEIAIILIMSGMIVLPVYMMLTSVSSLKNSEDKMEMIISGLAEHLRVYGTLPCPADETLDSDDADYGTADCGVPSTPGVTGPRDILIGAVPVETLIDAMDCGTRIGGTTPTAAEQRQQGVFRKNVQRIKDVIAGTTDENTNIDKTMCLGFEHMLDDRGNKFLYAVVEDATTLNTFDADDPTFGTIRVEDENGNPATTNGQLFVLVSFGDDGKGARTRNGALNGAIACTAASGDDFENCDRDGTFIAALRNDSIGAGHYDDHIDFSVAGMLREHDFWSWSSATATSTPVEENMVFNRNVNRLVIDQMTDPSTSIAQDEDKLVVNRGDMSIQGNDLRAESSGGVGGTVRARAGMRSNVDVEAVTRVVAPQFCYDPPVTPACGAP